MYFLFGIRPTELALDWSSFQFLDASKALPPSYTCLPLVFVGLEANPPLTHTIQHNMSYNVIGTNAIQIHVTKYLPIQITAGVKMSTFYKFELTYFFYLE